MTTVGGTKLARHARKTEMLSVRAQRKGAVVHLASLRAQSRAPMGTTVVHGSLKAKLPAIKPPGKFQRRIAPGISVRSRFTGRLHPAKASSVEKVPK